MSFQTMRELCIYENYHDYAMVLFLCVDARTTYLNYLHTTHMELFTVSRKRNKIDCMLLLLSFAPTPLVSFDSAINLNIMNLHDIIFVQLRVSLLFPSIWLCTISICVIISHVIIRNTHRSHFNNAMLAFPALWSSH